MGAGLVAMTVPGLFNSRALADPAPRRVALHNLHTGEAVDATYWEGGAYVADALAEMNKVLRDFRTGEIHPIDTRLIDLLSSLSAQLGTAGPFRVISGFRSPATNAMLRARSSGVASKSLHMQGLAIDLSLADRDLSSLRKAATGLRGGGVGYYPADGFVHLDAGPVRYWTGSGGQA